MECRGAFQLYLQRWTIDLVEDAQIILSTILLSQLDVMQHHAIGKGNNIQQRWRHFYQSTGSGVQTPMVNCNVFIPTHSNSGVDKGFDLD